MASKLIDLNALTDAVNFYDLATYFGEEKIIVSYSNVKILCPFHEEKTPSCFYSIEKKNLFCFACSTKSDLFGYVKKKLGTESFKEAIDFLCRFTGLNPELVDGAKRPVVPEYTKNLSALNKLTGIKGSDFEAFSDDSINAMVDLRGSFFSDRGLSKETLDFFQVGFDEVEKRIVLPIRDEDGALVGATGRTIYKDYKEKGIPKWKHYKNSSLSTNFFNINNAIKASKDKKGCIILCEGPNDVMFMHQSGYQNTVGCLRNFITDIQKWILVKNFMSVYIFLDGDKGGETGKSNIAKELEGYLDVYYVKPLDGKDPDEHTKEEIDNAIKSATKLC